MNKLIIAIVATLISISTAGAKTTITWNEGVPTTKIEDPYDQWHNLSNLQRTGWEYMDYGGVETSSDYYRNDFRKKFKERCKEGTRFLRSQELILDGMDCSLFDN